MRVSTQISLLLAAAGAHVSAQDATTGQLGDAAAITNNPENAVYKAILPRSAFFEPAYPEGGNIEGEVTARAGDGGKGVRFSVKLNNLPSTGGPFTYHLHVNPVPVTGNCTETLAHLDPYIRGEDPSCNKDAPETCQVGDLSGKHGKIQPGDDLSFEAEYIDDYATTVEGLGAFFGNRSIVFHFPNKTRITCASFERVRLPGGGNGDSSSTASSPSSFTTPPSSFTTPPPTSTSGSGGDEGSATASPTSATSSVSTGAAAILGSGAGGIAAVAGLVAMMF
ncbi:superoxide dismutase [Dichotomopilus funicola]|uniref:superoxide dismutase n=1 Tax=Dichotomopilus funicola TaxID=1934379 RepID=A0AAN6V6U4_9PEZI|nr:superoxide dismutase [Dichotomopilus funicola]